MATSLPRWWSKDTVAVVTGSNKGIGYEIVRGLAKNGVTTVLTARDSERGQKATETLRVEGLDSVLFHPLDVTSDESVENLASWLKKKFNGVDILINNAATASKEMSYEADKATFETNYDGVKRVTAKLLPLLRPGARVINISSLLGQLRHLRSETLKKNLDDEEHLTVEQVDLFAAKYLEDVKAGRWEEEGWATTYPGYTNSKIILNAYTRAFSKALSTQEQKVSVNLVHPGYIATDLNDHTGHGTPEEGADTAVWLALLPEENYPHGKFFFKRELFEF